MPEVPDISGSVKDTASLQYLLGAQWRTINRGGSSIMVGALLYFHESILTDLTGKNQGGWL
jgi:hypothetical protein